MCFGANKPAPKRPTSNGEAMSLSPSRPSITEARREASSDGSLLLLLLHLLLGLELLSLLPLLLRLRLSGDEI